MDSIMGMLFGAWIGFVVGAGIVMGVDSNAIARAEAACAANGGLNKITGSLLGETKFKCSNGAVFVPKEEEE